MDYAHKPCRGAVEAAGKAPLEQMAKAEFDTACRAGQFAEGPVVDSFGDGPGEPYNPNRQAWGKLTTGGWVWAWVRGPLATE